MKWMQTWTGYRVVNGICDEGFPATVPGNIQYDYAVAHGFADVMYADGCRQFEALESDGWEYRTTLRFERRAHESVHFVSFGIDYQYEIRLNGDCLLAREGVFSPVDLDLTDHLTGKDDQLCVRIYPHPKREGALDGRSQADHSCKPPVCYGWDWNPRLLISGMWQEAYIETRGEAFITSCEVRYQLSEDFSRADVEFEADCREPCVFTLYDRDGQIVYQGTDRNVSVANPHLWWCNGQGEPYLYTWKAETAAHAVGGRIGFRTVRLVRNTDAEDPKKFPKSRYEVPFTLELNGRRVFMKGTNWVNPDIFWGRITNERYEELIRLATDAHMNIFRIWGGAGPNKQAFYDLCDEYGLLVWQEFMLACNAYPDDARYLRVLEEEASAIIRSLRSHACLAFWCGGNELFNGWSGMTDQSLPLRLLNSLCYTLDRERPFLPTSPLMGMGHGGYLFYDANEEMGGDVFQVFARSHNLAYTEFGIPSMASSEVLERIIPREELFPIRPTEAWVLHHGLQAWKPQSHVCPEILEHYWGEAHTLSDMIEHSNWLQCVGYQVSFEEMRRQWPHCSAALNWCYNEPWLTAANCSLLSYPATPKPAYNAVKQALRPVLFSARIPKFDWTAGERFTAAIWLLNDSPQSVRADVTVVLKVGGEELPLLDWKQAVADANTNTEGATICCRLPNTDAEDMMLCLRSRDGFGSEYRLLYRPTATMAEGPRRMNE